MDSNAKTLMNADKAFSTLSVKQGAAAAFSRFLTSDAVQLSQNSLPIKGRSTIVQAMAKDDDVILSWQPQAVDISQSGDLGYTWGSFTVSSQANPSNIILTGKYLNIWRKQPDGSWKVVIDMGNHNPEG